MILTWSQSGGHGGIPPIISAIVATPVVSDVTVTWTTDLASDSVVQYGPTIAYGTSVGDLISMVTSHSITLFGVADGTYHFIVSSKTPANGLAISADGTFSVGAKAVILFSLPYPVYVNMNGTRQSVVGTDYLNETVV